MNGAVYLQVSEIKEKKPLAEFESMRVPRRAYERLKAEKRRREEANPSATITLGGIIEDAISAMQASPIPAEHRELVDQIVRFFTGPARDPEHQARRNLIEAILENFQP